MAQAMPILGGAQCIVPELLAQRRIVRKISDRGGKVWTPARQDSDTGLVFAYETADFAVGCANKYCGSGCCGDPIILAWDDQAFEFGSQDNQVYVRGREAFRQSLPWLIVAKLDRLQSPPGYLLLQGAQQNASAGK